MHRKLIFTVTEGPFRWHTHRIMELCEHLTESVLAPMFERENAKWDRRFINFFNYDNGCDPLEPLGKIHFTVPPLFSGRVGELEASILSEFARLKIKTAPFTYEKDSNFGSIRSITIQITENPTALFAPPDVNMSHTRGCVVLRDLLGYQKVNGRYEFTADDLVRRASSVTEENIAACTASPVKLSEGVRRTPSQVSMKAIRRCLEEVQQFGRWALAHNYRLLAAI
jgi:hypothetical protein